jgi:hypothetical protein
MPAIIAGSHGGIECAHKRAHCGTSPHSEHSAAKHLPRPCRVQRCAGQLRRGAPHVPRDDVARPVRLAPTAHSAPAGHLVRARLGRCSQYRLDPRRCDHAGTQQCRRVRQQADDGRFHSDGTRSATDNEVDGISQFVHHVRRRGRRNPAEAAGLGCDQRAGGGIELLGHRMRRHAQWDTALPAGHHIRNVCVPGQNERERPRPEGTRQFVGGIGYRARPVVQHFGRGEVNSERMVSRPPLDGEYASHRGDVHSFGAETLNGFGREGH